MHSKVKLIWVAKLRFLTKNLKIAGVVVVSLQHNVEGKEKQKQLASKTHLYSLLLLVEILCTKHIVFVFLEKAELLSVGPADR